MNFLEVVFGYSGLIFAIGGILLAIPGYLAFLYNRKTGESWPLRSTVPMTLIFIVFVLAFYSLAVYVGGYYWLATWGMVAQAVAWMMLVIQRLGAELPSQMSRIVTVNGKYAERILEELGENE